MMSRIEWSRITNRLGYTPAGDETLICPMLSGNHCNVYAIRPLICRLWGLTPKMRCPWGCEPERWLSEPETRELLAEMERLGR